MLRGIVLATLLSAFATACSGPNAATGAPFGSPSPAGDAAGASHSCVETYSPGTLVHRSFAFDGTVQAVDVRRDPRLPAGEREVPWVTFDVNQWFRGGTADVIGVWIDGLNIATSAGTIRAQPGTRLLVAGDPRWGGKALEDPIAWPCGFTQEWTVDAAAEWDAAFSA